MWIRDGCAVVAFPIDLATTDGAKPITTYTRRIFELAHNVPVYLTSEPVVVPVKINSIKRFIVLPPLSAIICSNIEIELPGKLYKVVDGTWVDVGIVTPYVRDSLCGSAKLLNLALDIDNANGIPYLCLSDSFIDHRVSEYVINGGFVEITDMLKEDVIDNMKIESSRDLLHVIIKHIVDYFYEKFKKQIVRFRPLVIDKSLRIYVKPLISINPHLVVVKIGRGFIYSLDTNTDLTQILYHILLLRVFVKDLDL